MQTILWWEGFKVNLQWLQLPDGITEGQLDCREDDRLLHGEGKKCLERSINLHCQVTKMIMILCKSSVISNSSKGM